MNSSSPKTEKQTLMRRLKDKAMSYYDYCAEGVWSDTSKSWKVNFVKTLNLSVTSFLNKDLQSTASAMAFSTLLATVPALALLFAIGRGFGFSNLMKSSLLSYFPAQREAIEKGLMFVDSYLEQASEGIFVGVGILFLLWSLISLVSSAETAFNKIWGVAHGRSVWRKVTDYTAIFLILPVLMICATGINVLMSSTLQTMLPFEFISPLLSGIIDSAGVVIIWIFFTGVYLLLPNTKVKLKHAFVAGILSGTSFTILQWLFVSGQIYVSKYNAIYGSFAFLPLLMLWLQLVWVITLAGGVICYSAQNIFRFSFSTQISKISFDYRRKILLSTLAIIAREYKKGNTPPGVMTIATDFGFPVGLVSEVIEELVSAGLVLKVIVNQKEEEIGFVPAIPLNELSVGVVVTKLRSTGASGFIPDFENEFHPIVEIVDNMNQCLFKEGSDIMLAEIEIDSLKSIKKHSPKEKTADTTENSDFNKI